MPTDKKPSDQLNLLFYRHIYSPHHHLTHLLPFYTYEYSPRNNWDKFFFIPLLSGYAAGRNPEPETLPFLAPYHWYSPFLTLGATPPSTHKDLYTFLSLPLGTLFQEERYPGKYEKLKWYSFPILSFYESEMLFEKEMQIGRACLQSPLFLFTNYTLAMSSSQRVPMYEWRLSPIGYLLGNEGLNIMKLARWGRDREFSCLDFAELVLFKSSQTCDYYPGANLERFRHSGAKLRCAMNRLVFCARKHPLTHLGLLDPILSFESSADGYFRWELLPLWHYRQQEGQYALTFLPLGLEWGSQGLRFAPKPKLFPLLYHDEKHGRWDILWPLFYYVDDPAITHRQLGIRLLLQYDIFQNDMGQADISVAIGQRLLAVYHSTPQRATFQLLRGYLFCSQKTSDSIAWSLLYGLLGYGKTHKTEYLHLFFLKIPLRESK